MFESSPWRRTEEQEKEREKTWSKKRDSHALTLSSVVTLRLTDWQSEGWRMGCRRGPWFGAAGPAVAGGGVGTTQVTTGEQDRVHQTLNGLCIDYCEGRGRSPQRARTNKKRNEQNLSPSRAAYTIIIPIHTYTSLTKHYATHGVHTATDYSPRYSHSSLKTQPTVFATREHNTRSIR
jgi:hypothetical protein